MEDTKSLLMMVLHKIFQNQPKTIENMFQLIHSFNNGKIEKKNYERTLKSICDLMNDELPSPILFYILTLVDMPQDFDSQSPIIEKMRRTHDFLPDINVRPYLLEYLNNIRPSHSSKCRKGGKEQTSERREISENVADASTTKSFEVEDKAEPAFIKPTRALKRTKKLLTRSPKTLLDICASYVVAEENVLKSAYKKQQSLAWALINDDLLSGLHLRQCYDVLKDLNRKMKWLREIESGNISAEMLMEEYKDTDIFLKQNHMFHETEKDPFEVPVECEDALNDFFADEQGE